MRLSVKELPDLPQTGAYYRQLAAGMGDKGAVQNLGQPPTTSGNVALTVADVILACWSGD